MTKKRHRNHELEQHSRGRLLTILSEWVVNSLDEDYAFDFEIRTTNRLTGSSAVIPAPFYAQLKATERIDDPESVNRDLETEFLVDDCLQASVPVVLFIYERRSDEMNWCVVQQHCWDVLDERRDGWRDQSEVRVTIDRELPPGTIHLAELRNVVERVQRRITMREKIASARRKTFEHPPGTSFATTEEVREHKSDLLNEAMALSEAAHEDRARRKVMDVYQLPEDDEPTLEAIQCLLEMNDTDDPSVAFAKIWFTREGRDLATKYGREELLDPFEATYHEAWDYIEEQFIGATYEYEEPLRRLTVLDVVDWDVPAGGADLVALVQYGVGEFGDESAQGLADGDQPELIESGESRNPREEACDEHEHDFDPDVLQKAPMLATCSECDLSRATVRQWLKQDVPDVCDECGTISYDVVYRRDTGRCPDCRES